VDNSPQDPTHIWIDDQIKDQIRKSVFQGLSDPQRKIRTSCVRTCQPTCSSTHSDCPQALTISEIASCDWPDQYPDLLSSIIGLLSSGSPDMVHGAMRLFTEFVRNDLSEDQLLPVMRELVPVLLTILGDSKVPLFLSSPIHPFTSSCSIQPTPAPARSLSSVNVSYPCIWSKTNTQPLCKKRPRRSSPSGWRLSRCCWIWISRKM